MTRLSPRLQNALLAVGSLAFFLALLEGGARVAWPASDSGSCFVPDTLLLYRPRPGCVRLFRLAENDRTVTLRYNACGVRASDDRACAAPRAFRIVGLGDSFTEAAVAPLADTYLETARRRLAPDTVEVVNLGVGGYDLLQYADRLDEALAFHPDLVTVGLLPNDLFEDLSDEAIAARRKRTRRLGPKAVAERRKTDALSGMKGLVRGLLSRSRLALVLQHMIFGQDALYRRVYLARGEAAGYLAPVLDSTWEARVHQASGLLERMHRRASEAGIALMVVFIPQRIQAVLLEQPAPGVRDPRSLARRLGEECARRGIRFIDFSDALARHPAPGRLYFPVDGHLTIEGQRLLGAFLADSLRRGR